MRFYGFGASNGSDRLQFRCAFDQHMLLSNSNQVSFTAEDGFCLVGTVYESNQSSQPSRVVLINSGAGIPASYYRRFAEWLAEAGFPTLTYDYRGVGLSRPRSLRQFPASVEDWGSKDCAAAIQLLVERYPATPIAVVGHSIGCFLTGFVKWRPEIDRMLFVAPHTGYFGDYASGWRPIMWFAWHVLMPVATRIFGFFPGKVLGLPDDLPRGVAIEWASRTKPEFWWNLRRPDGSLDTELRDKLLNGFARFRGTALAIQIADDAFATSDGARRVASLFANLKWQDQVVSPRSSDEGRIGHFGFFRAMQRDSLWPLALNWLRGPD